MTDEALFCSSKVRARAQDTEEKGLLGHGVEEGEAAARVNDHEGQQAAADHLLNDPSVGRVIVFEEHAARVPVVEALTVRRLEAVTGRRRLAPAIPRCLSFTVVLAY